MIVSVHIRKAAGSSFRKALKEYYGNELLLDYGDEIGSSRLSSQIKRLKSLWHLQFEKNNIIKDNAIIHGHFYAKKYRSLKTNLQYATFLRDPVERVLSNYYYLSRNKDRKHGDAVVVNKYKYSLEEYICHGDAKNVQSQFLSNIPLSDFSFVGLTEEYEMSISMFNIIFGAELTIGHNENSNPHRGTSYEKSDAIVELIQKNNEQDFELYEQAKEIFYKQRSLITKT